MPMHLLLYNNVIQELWSSGYTLNQVYSSGYKLDHGTPIHLSSYVFYLAAAIKSHEAEDESESWQERNRYVVENYA